MEKNLRTILFDKYDSYPKEHERIFNILESQKQFEEDYSLAGFGLMPEKPEGMSLAYDDPLGGYATRYTHVSYALGFRVTDEMLKDDQYGKIKKMPKGLAKSANATVEQNTANIFNFGFVNTFNVGGDGQPLFSELHPLRDGGVYPNTPAVPGDLSATTLQQAILAMEETVDDRGLLLAIKPKLVVVPPDLRWTARELLESHLKPHVQTNEINALKEDDLSYFVWHYLTDDDAWFLLADKDEHELNFFWRERLQTDSQADFDAGAMKFKAFMRFSCKWSDWRGVYGNPGG